MSDNKSANKLSAFAVSLVFEDGPIVTATYLAPDAMLALALVSVDAARQTDKRLVAYGVQPIGEDWLRHALKVVEGNGPKAPVFSLVNRGLGSLAAHTQAEDKPSIIGNRCWRHPEQVVIDGFCPTCHGPNLADPA
jgi:hypothetical protein